MAAVGVLALLVVLAADAGAAKKKERPDAITEAVGILQSAKTAGQGSRENQRALVALTGSGERAMLPILTGFQKATPEGLNWLRNAFEQIAESLRAARKPLPADALRAFVMETGNSADARRLAWDTLVSEDARLAEQVIPGMLNDPSPEFRRDAVELLLKQAAQVEGAAATDLYRRALGGAVHEDQVKTIAEALRKAGETVDISRHFGFVTSWKIVGPFDNREEKGFAVAYAPETEIAQERPNVEAEYDGMNGKVRWQTVETTDDFGVVDIAKQIENFKGSVMYAVAEWSSPAQQTLQVRLGTPNAWKLWVNGALVFEREEYHRSTQLDQYSVPVQLKPGVNVLAFKICQNEQTQDWAQKYQFQLRVCDSTGVGVLPGPVVVRNGVSRKTALNKGGAE
ncbi:MAG TPA: hypothetical protein DC058_04610 [Planctomycetaceae bacterium]|nr:hypothetical protein [Planctomycetaceae bacterium]HBC60483.1 hypothetical protein [Planctomycetaceae bacterium]